MKSTELHATTVSLGAVRWGSFELILEGTNTAGTWCRCTVLIDWRLWPMIAGYAALAWLKEKQYRASDMIGVEATLPRAAVEPQAEERKTS